MKITAYRTPYRESDAQYDTMEIDAELDNGSGHFSIIRVYGEAIEPVRAILMFMGVPERE